MPMAMHTAPAPLGTCIQQSRIAPWCLRPSKRISYTCYIIVCCSGVRNRVLPSQCIQNFLHQCWHIAHQTFGRALCWWIHRRMFPSRVLLARTCEH